MKTLVLNVHSLDEVKNGTSKSTGNAYTSQKINATDENGKVVKAQFFNRQDTEQYKGMKIAVSGASFKEDFQQYTIGDRADIEIEGVALGTMPAVEAKKPWTGKSGGWSGGASKQKYTATEFVSVVNNIINNFKGTYQDERADAEFVGKIVGTFFAAGVDIAGGLPVNKAKESAAKLIPNSGLSARDKLAEIMKDS